MTQPIKLKLVGPPPKRDPKSFRAVNPFEQAALLRYKSIYRLVKGGLSEEEAIAKYDVPRGICRECGVTVPPKRRICEECSCRIHTIKAREKRARKDDLLERTCKYPGCSNKFFGRHYRGNCDVHFGARPDGITYTKPRGRPRNQRSSITSASGGNVRRQAPPVQIKESPFPDTWDKPLPENKKESWVKPEPVRVIPPGANYTIAAPIPWGRWEGN